MTTHHQLISTVDRILAVVPDEWHLYTRLATIRDSAFYCAPEEVPRLWSKMTTILSSELEGCEGLDLRIASIISGKEVS